MNEMTGKKTVSFIFIVLTCLSMMNPRNMLILTTLRADTRHGSSLSHCGLYFMRLFKACFVKGKL